MLAPAAKADMSAVELYQQTPLLMALALIELDKLNPEGVPAYLAPVMSEGSTSEFWGQLRVTESRSELLRGHGGIAMGSLELVLQKAKEQSGLNPIDANELAVVGAELAMGTGNTTAAQGFLNRLPAKSAALLMHDGGGRISGCGATPCLTRAGHRSVLPSGAANRAGPPGDGSVGSGTVVKSKPAMDPGHHR